MVLFRTDDQICLINHAYVSFMLHKAPKHVDNRTNTPPAKTDPILTQY